MRTNRPCRLLRVSLILMAIITGVLRGAAESDLPDGMRFGVQAEPQTATVGDPVRVRIEVTHPSGFRVEIPQPGNQLGDWTVISFSRGSTEDAGNVNNTVDLVLAAYKTGVHEIPGIPVRIVTADGTELTRTSPATQARIESVLTGENPELKGLKRQAEIEESFPVLRWLLVLAVAAALVSLAWYCLRRRRPAHLMAASQPHLDVLEVAEAELRDLLARALPEKGFIKQYYVALSDIVRRILEGGYEIATAEKTTTEIIEALREAASPQPGAARLAHIEALLEGCDLVKFAKYVPGRDEIESATKATFDLLDHCRQRRAAAAAAGPAVGAA